MKKSYVLLALFFASFFSFVPVDAQALCKPEVSLLNQDPYPVVPGEYVRLVFQIQGIEDPRCGDINFELIEDYPIRFDPDETGLRTFKKVNYVKDYKSNILVPFRVQIDDEALDGANPIEISIQSGREPKQLKTFDVEIDDIRATFELSISEYDYDTRELTIEILNVADADIEALALEIPKQENVVIKGANRVIVGDLDSNEYSSASFEAIPQNGKIDVTLAYSDSVGERRNVQSAVWFDETYFTNRVADQEEPSKVPYYIGGAVVLYLLYRWNKKRKKKNKK